MPAPERYASCPYDGCILDYYAGHFDSVYVLLHPFLRPTRIPIDRFFPKTWPGKHEIVDGVDAVSWQELLSFAGFDSIAQIDVALRTSIGGLKQHAADEALANDLDDVAERHGLVYPSEGDIPPLLENALYERIKGLGYDWLWVGDEFCTERRLRLIDDLIAGSELPRHGSVFTPDKQVLVTTHWDSHYSLLCAPREKIDTVLGAEPFEGFYCDADTEIYWSLRDAGHPARPWE